MQGEEHCIGVWQPHNKTVFYLSIPPHNIRHFIVLPVYRTCLKLSYECNAAEAPLGVQNSLPCKSPPLTCSASVMASLNCSSSCSAARWAFWRARQAEVVPYCSSTFTSCMVVVHASFVRGCKGLGSAVGDYGDGDVNGM